MPTRGVTIQDTQGPQVNPRYMMAFYPRDEWCNSIISKEGAEFIIRDDRRRKNIEAAFVMLPMIVLH